MTSLPSNKKRIPGIVGAITLSAGLLMGASAMPAFADVSATYDIPETSPEKPLILLTTGTTAAPVADTVDFSMALKAGTEVPSGILDVKYSTVAGIPATDLSCVLNVDGTKKTATSKDGLIGFEIPKTVKVEGVDKGLDCHASVPSTKDNKVDDEEFHQGQVTLGLNKEVLANEPVYAVVGNNIDKKYPQDWAPKDTKDKYKWAAVADAALPNIVSSLDANQKPNVVPTSMNVTYDNLTPENKYTLTTIAYDDSNKKVATITTDVTADAAKGTVKVDLSTLPKESKTTEQYRLVSTLSQGAGETSQPIAQTELSVTANPVGAALKVFAVDGKDKKTVLSGSTYSGWLCTTSEVTAQDKKAVDEFVDEKAEAAAVNQGNTKCESLDKYKLTMNEDGTMFWNDDLKVRANGQSFILLEETNPPKGYEAMHSKIALMPTEDGKWTVEGGDGAWVGADGAIYLPSIKEAAVTPTPTPTDDPTTEPTPTPTDDPTTEPTPTETPTTDPTPTPTEDPTTEPTPTETPTTEPTPTETPTTEPTPTEEPTESPSPSETPSSTPTETKTPTKSPSAKETTNAAPVNDNNQYPDDSGLNYYDSELAKTGADVNPWMLGGAAGLMLLGGGLIAGSAIVRKKNAA